MKKAKKQVEFFNKQRSISTITSEQLCYIKGGNQIADLDEIVNPTLGMAIMAIRMKWSGNSFGNNID